jgi:hypothetical protein
MRWNTGTLYRYAPWLRIGRIGGIQEKVQKSLT